MGKYANTHFKDVLPQKLAHPGFVMTTLFGCFIEEESEEGIESIPKGIGVESSTSKRIDLHNPSSKCAKHVYVNYYIDLLYEKF